MVFFIYIIGQNWSNVFSQELSMINHKGLYTHFHIPSIFTQFINMHNAQSNKVDSGQVNDILINQIIYMKNQRLQYKKTYLLHVTK